MSLDAEVRWRARGTERSPASAARQYEGHHLRGEPALQGVLAQHGDAEPSARQRRSRSGGWTGGAGGWRK